MCGRFRVKRSDKQAIAKHLGIRESDVPTYVDEVECAPGSMQSVVRIAHDERVMTEMRWGFSLTIQGKKRLVFNTKSEEVMNSKLWKPRFLKNRCIIPASAFFEWKKVNGKTGPKFEISADGRESFGFAGLWGEWTNPKTNAAEDTFSIFTTEPNERFVEYHNRQPVILEQSDYEEWITPTERPPVHLLRIFPEEKMKITQATPVATETSADINPISLGQTRSLFE